MGKKLALLRYQLTARKKVLVSMEFVVIRLMTMVDDAPVDQQLRSELRNFWAVKPLHTEHLRPEQLCTRQLLPYTFVSHEHLRP